MKKTWNRCVRYVKRIRLRISQHKDSIFKAISVLAQIGTMIAAIVALFALKEAILQRESIYKPELRIGETLFCADIRDIDNIIIYKTKDGYVDFSQTEKGAWFRIDNIGMGSALSVSINAQFKRELISPLLVNDKNIIDEDNVDNTILDTVWHGKDSLILINADVTREWRLDYVMPISQISEECKVDFSDLGFKKLVKTILWLKRAGQFKEYYEFIVPVELKYRDINDKPYTKETEMIIKFAMIETDYTKLFCHIRSGQPYLEQYNEFLNKGGDKDNIKTNKTYYDLFE